MSRGMSSSCSSFLVLFLLGLAALSSAEVLRAKVTIYKAGDDKPGDKVGDLDLLQENGTLTISGNLTGLPAGVHGFHVHEKPDLGKKCVAAGPHFNPHNKAHGAPEDNNRHVGDLGNVKVGADGSVIIKIEDSLATLDGENSILDRAIVIHEKADDLGKGSVAESKKTGNAGSRIACGKIESAPTSSSTRTLLFSNFLVLVLAIFLL